MWNEVSVAKGKLNRIYAESIRELKDSRVFSEEEKQQLSSPFLLSITEEYFKAPVHIFFVGQETAGWMGSLADTLQRGDPVNPLLQRYERQMRRGKWQSAFLKKYRLMENRLGAGQRGSIVWNNLHKMDVNRGSGQSRNARRFSESLDDFSARLFRYEFEVLKPEVVIFGCSYTYDYQIKKTFPCYRTIEMIEKRSLWKFSIGEATCFRTWHPSTIKYRGEKPFHPITATLLMISLVNFL